MLVNPHCYIPKMAISLSTGTIMLHTAFDHLSMILQFCFFFQTSYSSGFFNKQNFNQHWINYISWENVRQSLVLGEKKSNIGSHLKLIHFVFISSSYVVKRFKSALHRLQILEIYIISTHLRKTILLVPTFQSVKMVSVRFLKYLKYDRLIKTNKLESDALYNVSIFH